MQGLGKLLDDEIRRKPTVVQFEENTEGGDKTILCHYLFIAGT